MCVQNLQDSHILGVSQLVVGPGPGCAGNMRFHTYRLLQDFHVQLSHTSPAIRDHIRFAQVLLLRNSLLPSANIIGGQGPRTSVLHRRLPQCRLPSSYSIQIYICLMRHMSIPECRPTLALSKICADQPSWVCASLDAQTPHRLVPTCLDQGIIQSHHVMFL